MQSWHGYATSYSTDLNDNFGHGITLDQVLLLQRIMWLVKIDKSFGASTNANHRIGKIRNELVAPGFGGTPLSEALGNWQQFFKVTPNDAKIVDSNGAQITQWQGTAIQEIKVYFLEKFIVLVLNHPNLLFNEKLE